MSSLQQSRPDDGFEDDIDEMDVENMLSAINEKENTAPVINCTGSFAENCNDIDTASNKENEDSAIDNNEERATFLRNNEGSGLHEADVVALSKDTSCTTGLHTSPIKESNLSNRNDVSHTDVSNSILFDESCVNTNIPQDKVADKVHLHGGEFISVDSKNKFVSDTNVANYSVAFSSVSPGKSIASSLENTSVANNEHTTESNNLDSALSNSVIRLSPNFN